MDRGVAGGAGFVVLVDLTIAGNLKHEAAVGAGIRVPPNFDHAAGATARLPLAYFRCRWRHSSLVSAFVAGSAGVVRGTFIVRNLRYIVNEIEIVDTNILLTGFQGLPPGAANGSIRFSPEERSVCVSPRL